MGRERRSARNKDPYAFTVSVVCMVRQAGASTRRSPLLAAEGVAMRSAN